MSVAMAIDTGGPAFPRPFSKDGDTEAWSQEGLSVRDYFAAQALPAVYAARVTAGLDILQESLTAEAYEIADAMIEERRAKGGGA
jgi:hypothetical protein